jgi:hypothetical protein
MTIPAPDGRSRSPKSSRGYRSDLRKEKGAVIRISVQVGSETSTLRAVVRAESIQRAVGLARTRYPGSEVRVVFPIDPEAFFERESLPAEGSIWFEMPEEAAG